MRLLAIALTLMTEHASAGLPTPEGTRVVHVEQRGYAVDAYATDASPSQALATYQHALIAAHYRVRTIHGALAVRGRETAIVHAYREGDHTVLALVRLGDEEHGQ